MYKNNLSYAQLMTYVTFLMSRDLLSRNSDGYVTTKRGHRFLEAFTQLTDILEDVQVGLSSRSSPRDMRK